MMTPITRGELAKRCEVNPETIRFYERGGLLPEPERTQAGYRQYGEDAIQRVRFIKRAQNAGFSLDEVRALLDFQLDADDATCGDVRAMVDVKLREIDEQITRLLAMKKVLTHFRQDCPGGDESIEVCPILASFAEAESHDIHGVHEVSYA